MKTWLSWSSGKDSAWSLHDLRERDDVDVVGLLTSFNESAERVAMHAVRRALVHAQARAVGLPLIEIELPSPCSNAIYEERMGAACARAEREGVEAIAFGDLYLRDIRAYREEQLARTSLRPLFPLWERDTRALAAQMVHAGLGAVLTCVDPRILPAELAGRSFDAALLAELPPGVDPCGENGEFHTFVHAGPMFAEPLAIEVGETVERGGFVFADVLPASRASSPD